MQLVHGSHNLSNENWIYASVNPVGKVDFNNGKK